jgi:Xaa-Pro aminopeptidase
MPPSWRADWSTLDADSTVEVAPGMSFYSVVSLRLPGQYGVLVGDSWVCDATGAVRLTRCPRQLAADAVATGAPGATS